MTHPPIDHLLGSGYLGDLRARPIAEIRAMRAECQEVELGLSYLRQLVQGTLDIVASERQRRAQGGPADDVSSLVQRLPEILAPRVSASGAATVRLSDLRTPDDADEAALRAELDAVVDADALSSLADTPGDEVTDLVHRLSDLERSVSRRRHGLHERIDALQAELTRRYKTGEATVESLLH